MSKHQAFSSGQIKSAGKTNRCFEVCILLTDGFSLLSLASLVEVLGTVADVDSSARVKVRLVSADGLAVRTKTQSQILPDGALGVVEQDGGEISGCDAVFVCSGQNLSGNEAKLTISLMRWSRRAAIPVCLMGDAVRVAAKKGHLSKGTDHWSRIPANNEAMPHVEFSNSIFVQDRNLVTCCGELGAVDFALHWVGQRISPLTANKIRNQLLVASARSADRAQTCTVSDMYKGAPKALQRAISVMIENLETLDGPLRMPKIAHSVGLSVRQVERLFARHLSTSPVKFYRSKKLEKAKSLIEDTDLPLTEIALACGFSSFSSFGSRFRKKYGLSPTQIRSTLLSAV